MAGLKTIERFREIAAALPLNADFFDRFNADIQREIEQAPPALALELGTVKLEANKRLYEHNRRRS